MDVIVSFDTAEEKFKDVVPLPVNFDEDLGKSGNCLRIFGEGLGSYFEAWIISEHDKTSMTKLFGVPCDRFGRDFKKEKFFF